MNDFSDIENELKKLRPRQPSAQLVDKIEQAFVDLAVQEKIVRPARFQIGLLSLGAGLAAAALVLVFLHYDFQRLAKDQNFVAANSPAPQMRPAIADPGFVPSSATQVVYHMRDEGLVYPSGSNEPVRRTRAFTHETLQWRNAATGASLRVSYPTEQVELIPISGQ